MIWDGILEQIGWDDANMKDAFATFHPIVIFVYFVVVILFSMFIMHPMFLGISLICAFIYSITLNGKKAIQFNFLFLIPFLIIAALINPLFNHEGITILWYAYSGNPITLESILYGIAAAVMFVSVICWFSCYNAVMTSDKFIYLFGRIIPGLSLIFSMVLRFVPKYKAQIQAISNAQKCIGRDISNGNIIQRARHGIRIVSIMITWALENAIETADSMKSRGYGLKGRTSFSIFRFDDRDKLVFVLMLALILFILIGASLGVISMRYYPSIQAASITPLHLCVSIAYTGLCLLPVMINLLEARKWKYLQSKI